MFSEMVGGVAVDHVDGRRSVACARFVGQVVGIGLVQIGVGEGLQQVQQFPVGLVELGENGRSFSCSKISSLMSSYEPF
jgi:hypothetical protein